MATDRMTLGDGAAIALECGHPNTKEGERCALCGKEIPVKEPEKQKGD